MRNLNRTRKTLCLLLTGLLMFAELTLTGAYAQGVPDATPPVIEHEGPERAAAASRQVFTAQVVDDRVLRDVTLYHRRDGELPYRASPMNALADSAFFSASIPTDPRDSRRIEYYLQARDTGGNRTVSGFAFDPWMREIVASAPAGGLSPPAVTGPGETSAPIAIGGVAWWKVALGVVAVGALAALAGGGGSGSGADDGDVPFTLTLGEPR